MAYARRDEMVRLYQELCPDRAGTNNVLSFEELSQFMVTMVGNRSIRKVCRGLIWQVVERDGSKYVQNYIFGRQRKYGLFYHQELVPHGENQNDLRPKVVSGNDQKIYEEWIKFDLHIERSVLTEIQLSVETMFATRSGKIYSK